MDTPRPISTPSLLLVMLAVSMVIANAADKCSRSKTLDEDKAAPEIIEGCPRTNCLQAEELPPLEDS
jgi:hypothetical protein